MTMLRGPGTGDGCWRECGGRGDAANILGSIFLLARNGNDSCETSEIREDVFCPVQSVAS